jgi:hypothetical protein
MTFLSTNLLGGWHKFSEAGASSGKAIFSGSAEGGTASVSGTVGASTDDQNAYSSIDAIALAKADDTQVTSIGNTAATGDTATTLMSLSAGVDPDGETVGEATATVVAYAEATQDGLASAATGAALQIEADDIEITSSGASSASGATAATLVDMSASLDQKAEIAVVDLAAAEAQAAQDSNASAIASTDATATDGKLVISKEQETTMTDGSHPTVLSVTYLQGYQATPEAATIDPLTNDADITQLQMDFDFLAGEL